MCSLCPLAKVSESASRLNVREFPTDPLRFVSLVTQKWEPNGQRQAIETSQGASTMPDADGGHENKPGFGDKVGGFAKKLSGKATGKVSQHFFLLS